MSDKTIPATRQEQVARTGRVFRRVPAEQVLPGEEMFIAERWRVVTRVWENPATGNVTIEYAGGATRYERGTRAWIA